MFVGYFHFLQINLFMQKDKFNENSYLVTSADILSGIGTVFLQDDQSGSTISDG